MELGLCAKGKLREQNKVFQNVWKDEELFMFNVPPEPFPSVLRKHSILKHFIVIGQKVDSLKGIEELVNLEELWLVHAGLQQETIQPLCSCSKLKSLYLYDNVLTAIPDFSGLGRLARLWLGDNQITSLQNINTLRSVKELYLCNNQITKIDVRIGPKMELFCLNVSGNPLTSLKDVSKLSPLKSLRWLILSDPLYRRTPITVMANYRVFVLYTLPHLELLDLVMVTDSEKKHVLEFYESKMQFYRVALNNALAHNVSAQKSSLEAATKEFELIWSSLHHYSVSDKGKMDGDQNRSYKFWEEEAQRWKEKKELSVCHFKILAEITKRKFQLELEYSGNLRFDEVDLKSPRVEKLVSKRMSTFICSYLKDKVSEVRLLNVWSVQGPFTTTIAQSQFTDDSDDVFILNPVQGLSTKLLGFVENYLFGANSKTNLKIANCFMCVDALVSVESQIHRQLLLRSLRLVDSRMLLLCGVVGGDQLLKNTQVDCPSCSGHPSLHCHLLPLPETSALVPLYLVHFQYVFKDYFKPLKVPPKETLEPNSSSFHHGVLSPPCNIQDWHTISKMNLSYSKLYQLADIPTMNQVTVMDLSYNFLQDLSPLAKAFPKLMSLDLTFNRITSLDSLKSMSSLSQLVLAWNLVTDVRRALQKLRGLDKLRHLDLRWNPFTDVTSSDHVQVLAGRHLKKLLTYNGHSLTSSMAQEPFLGPDQYPSVPAWHGPSRSLTLKWKAEMASRGVGNHFGTIGSTIVSVVLRHLRLTQFRSAIPLEKLRWFDLSHNYIIGASVLKGLSNLEEVNLSYNMVDSFNCQMDKFNKLTKLNLSQNRIMSLTTFSVQCFPNLKFLDLSNNFIKSLTGMSGAKSLVELYLCHNLLEDCETLMHLKSCRMLQVLDLTCNPLTASSTFRQTCLHYLTSLKFINGSRVQEGEIKKALALYRGLLDQDYLLKVYSQPTLENITQISLTNQSLREILLPNASFVNVVSITLDHNKISNLSWISVFPNLGWLSLASNKVTSYSGKPSSSTSSNSIPRSNTFSNSFPALQCLVLSHNNICYLQPLRLGIFSNLKTLMLNNNEISSVVGLQDNCQLQQLILTSNKLTSISPEHIARLVNLVELHLERNSLTRLDFLRPLKKLHKLFIGFNKVVAKSSLSSLTELPELQELTIHGNPLFRRPKSYEQCLPDLPALKTLEGHPVNTKPKG